MIHNWKPYEVIVAEWRVKYPPPVVRAVFDPTQIRACCIRCGSGKKVQRHHTGNDFYFACLRPDLYASTYLQFLSSQTAKLCENCHKLVHKNIKKMMHQVKHALNLLNLQYVALKGTEKFPTQEWCDYWMQEFRNWFAKWVQKPPRKRKRGKYGRRKHANK